MKFRTLNADEISCRVDELYNLEKWQGARILLYKNARVDMDILDETVGSENWQRDHKEVKGSVYCGISIYIDEKRGWVTKWDCGAESNKEKEKGEASDSFKRAGTNWGIGRELYKSPTILIPCEVIVDGNRKYLKDKKLCWSVESIEYANGGVSGLVIVDNKGNQVFTFGFVNENREEKGTTKVSSTAPESISEKPISKFQQLKKFAVSESVSLTEICEYAMKEFGAEKLNDLTDNQVDNIEKHFLSLKSYEDMTFNEVLDDNFNPSAIQYESKK